MIVRTDIALLHTVKRKTLPKNILQGIVRAVSPHTTQHHILMKRRERMGKKGRESNEGRGGMEEKRRGQ
jgi:hypothetical protein